MERQQDEITLREAELAVRTELAIAAREVDTDCGGIASTRTAVNLAERRLEGRSSAADLEAVQVIPLGLDQPGSVR